MAGIFDPAKHHRRSIRLKGHDYAGGGLYFVTVCAHREFVGATCVSPVPPGAPFAPPIREIMAEEWARCGELRDDISPGEFVVMPDHFHGLIEIRPGASGLGHVIGAFKAAVSRRIRMDGEHVAPDTRIWHRNYYERIVRTPEAAENIRRYIRMNPWKCIQDFGNGLRGMGNPALCNAEKVGVLCSRNAPPVAHIPDAEVYLGGFHSPPEQKILEELLKRRARIIYCPAWGLAGAMRPDMLAALEDNRMLLLEMKNRDGNLAPPNCATASLFRTRINFGSRMSQRAACSTGCCRKQTRPAN
jgi:REP element-mobilizing transposase RayT